MPKTKKPINTNKLILNEIINNTFARHKELLQELDLSSFDGNITLQDYQIKALENALIALKLFYQSGADDLIRYYRKETGNITEQNINRASFWMATGSGKSIVMIKLIACLDTLFKRGVFIKRPIMLLAPNDKILSQFKAHIQQYNTFAQKQITIKELKEFESNANHLFSDTEILLYIARSDLLESIENVGKDSNAKRLYYKNYLNKEGWYILLDEAHKGDSKDSIRKSYYNELAKGLKEDGKQESRKGFIFNFSATFSDAIDKDTCAFNYNLERFNSDGYGKNIVVLDSNLKAFKDLNNPQAKINHILESFIVFYAIKKTKKELFKKAEALSIRLQYHNPLIIAVSDKVNTKDAGIKLYFEAILQVLGNKITQDELRAIADNLCNKLRQEQIYFGNEGFSQSFLDLIQHVSLDELRLSIFYAKQVSSCEACRIKGNAKELVFKSKNSSKPFLLLNIGNAKEWEKEYIINLGIEIGEDLGKSYFEEINNEDCPINIMIGSKVFSEGWDSNRVNLISFINIGSINAKKYVLQTIGRGVRIEPIANERKRLNIYDKERLKAYNEGLETLFIMASDENAIKIILEQMQNFISKERLKGFKKSNHFKPLLIPTYKESKYIDKNYKISSIDYEAFQEYLHTFDEDIFLLTQNLKKDMGYTTLTKILNKENIEIIDAKSTLMPQNVLKTIDNFFNFNAKELEMYKELHDEICHYNQLSSTLDSQIIDAMNAKIKDLCKDTEKSTYDSKALFDLVTQGKMSFDEFNKQVENKKNNPTIFEHSGYILDSTLSKHYYNPIIIDKNKNGQIIYAIKEESEIEFLQDLKDFIQESNLLDSYEWCFCKLVENVDSIFIPYFDEQSQEYRKFYPDFIFWLKDKQTKSYKIFFIDPKGLQNPYNAKDKLKGFQAIFQTHRAKELNAKDNIEVFLYYYNKEINQDKELEAHIKGSIKGIFKSLEL